MPIWVDPERRSYDALGFSRSLGSTFSFASLRHGRRAWGSGNRQSRTQGDPWQQGGALIVQPSGEVTYRYASAAAGDHPEVSAVLAALGEGAD